MPETYVLDEHGGMWCRTCMTRLSDNGSGKPGNASAKPCPLGCGDEGAA